MYISATWKLDHRDFLSDNTVDVKHLFSRVELLVAAPRRCLNHKMPNLNNMFPSRPSLNITLPKRLNLAALGSPKRQTMGRRRSSSKPKVFDPKIEHVSSLQRSFSPADGVRYLRYQHKWTLFDLQYVMLAMFCLSSLWIIEAHAPFIKSAAVVGYTLLLLTPATSQFFLPSWPIWTYLLYFFSSR